MQSNRIRLTLITLLSALTLSALTATAAQAVVAPTWSIEGTTLAEGKTHYITGKIYTTTAAKRFTLAVATIAISCLAARFKEGVLLGAKKESGGTGSAIIELFGNCEIVGNGGPCSVTEPIVSNHLKSELVETAGAVPGTSGSLLMLFEPENVVNGFAKLTFTGSGCVATSTIVSGKVAAQVLTDPENGTLGALVELPKVNSTEAKSWLLNFPATPIAKVTKITEGKVTEPKIELTASGESAVIGGTALVALAKKNSKGELESETTLWSPLP
jgi:hypothetical protein